jgi:hypothetical protein
MVIQRAQVEKVAVLLEELAAALRLLMIDLDPEVSPPFRPEETHAPPPAANPGRNAIGIGSRVTINGGALDRYRGRTGVVLSQRGIHYWNLRLDIQGKETAAPLIYKKGTSLIAMPR